MAGLTARKLPCAGVGVTRPESVLIASTAYESVVTKSGPFAGWQAIRIGFESGTLIVFLILPVCGSTT